MHQLVNAGALRHGTRLRTPSGSTASVLGSWMPRQATGWMWDLTIPRDHDFYIDTNAASVLVHNNNCATYIDLTRGGSVQNVGTDTTHGEFAKTLTENGWVSQMSKDGTVQIFQKDGAKYVLRAQAGSYAGWTADYTPAGSPDITLKIRLGTKDDHCRSAFRRE